MVSNFAEDTLKGLSSSPKYLLSKYFYDEGGSRIFEEIMRMPEYYLTDCELEIFEIHKTDISREFMSGDEGFRLIELGAGDGLKTRILISQLNENNIHFTYHPVDISETSLHKLSQSLKQEFPTVKVHGHLGDYFQTLHQLKELTPKVILFLGSNIGNFTHSESVMFLEEVKGMMNDGDKLLIGFDLKKDPEIILTAYNDPQGLTAAFNLNLLCRINDELGADFNIDNFTHREEYDPETGTARSYLISMKKQQVHFPELGRTFFLGEKEKIYMEMSQKYDLQMINLLADQSGFEVTRNFYDKRHWFVNSLWKVKSKTYVNENQEDHF